MAAVRDRLRRARARGRARDRPLDDDSRLRARIGPGAPSYRGGLGRRFLDRDGRCRGSVLTRTGVDRRGEHHGARTGTTLAVASTPAMNGREARSVEDAGSRLIADVEALRKTRPQEAWTLLERQFPQASRTASPARRGELWRLRGHLLRALSQLPAAAQAYRRAEDWFDRAGDGRERGRCAIGLVDTLMYLGRYQEAEDVAARGRRALERAADRVSQARLLNNEGNLYHRLDRPDRALARYREARRFLARAGDRRGSGMVDGNIANCLSQLGRTTE